MELVDGAVQLLLQPRAIAVAGFDGAEAVVGRLERLLRDGELRPGVVALLDDGVDVLSPAFAVARADEEAAPRRGGRPEASSEGVSPWEAPMVNGRSEWRGTRLLAPMARERLRLDRYACEGCGVSVADGDGGARRVLGRGTRGHVGTR